MIFKFNCKNCSQSPFCYIFNAIRKKNNEKCPCYKCIIQTMCLTACKEFAEYLLCLMKE